MKEKIHPKFHEDAVVTCACGETFKTGSVLPAIKVEICSKCHPFFTGKTKVMDTAGRIEKFQKKHGNANLENAKPQRRVKVETKPETKSKSAAALKKEAKTKDAAEAPAEKKAEEKK